MEKISVLKSKRLLPFFALLPAFCWGFATPILKLGFAQFQISDANAGGKTLFAGIRFLVAGIIILCIAKGTHRDFTIHKSDWRLVFLFALVNTALHYFFFYMGVSFNLGSRAAVIDSLGTFLLVLSACAVFPEEHLTKRKLCGCLIGFGGLIILNLGGGEGARFNLLGDGFMVLNAVAAAAGGLLTRIVCKKIDALVATGYSLTLGGLILLLMGVLLHGTIPVVNATGVCYLMILISISVVGFSIYNQLLVYHSVGNVAIFNSLIPVIAVFMSCLLLGEPFSANYIFAVGFVAAGVYIINMNSSDQT